MNKETYTEMQQKIERILNQLNIKRLDMQRHQRRMMLLGFIAENPEGVNPSQMADYFNMARPLLTRLLDAFEDLGYITRRLDPEDKRRFKIVITERGLEDLQNSRADDEKRCEQLCAYLGEDDSMNLLRILDTINDFIDKEIPVAQHRHDAVKPHGKPHHHHNHHREG